jgi:hypothetical protein
MSTGANPRLAGVVAMLAALPMLFVWGFAFHLFGHPIHLNWQTAGFFGWIAFGLAGLGYTRSGFSGGIRYAGTFVAVAGGAVMLGIALGRSH